MIDIQNRNIFVTSMNDESAKSTDDLGEWKDTVGMLCTRVYIQRPLFLLNVYHGFAVLRLRGRRRGRRTVLALNFVLAPALRLLFVAAFTAAVTPTAATAAALTSTLATTPALTAAVAVVAVAGSRRRRVRLIRNRIGALVSVLQSSGGKHEHEHQRGMGGRGEVSVAVQQQHISVPYTVQHECVCVTRRARVCVCATALCRSRSNNSSSSSSRNRRSSSSSFRVYVLRCQE